MKIIATAIAFFLPLLAYSAEWNSLSGTYAITAENLIDPGEGELLDSHYRIQLRGDSAKDLFKAMKTAMYTDECTGGTAKSIGEMQCLHFEATDTYECHFSINLEAQQIEYGVVC